MQREYVDDVEHPALIDDALRGLVGGLDPYSSYLDAEEYADLRVSTAGTYAGIGIEVSTADRALRVVRPFRDSPAATAGIRSGDMIAAIDGAPVGADLDAAMARMRGPRGSHGEARRRARRVRRCRSSSPSSARRSTCTASRWPRIGGRLRVRAHHHFSATPRPRTSPPVSRALRRDLGAKPRGVIIDLRNNPGGVLESAVEVADQLLESGVIVERRRPHARRALQHGRDAGRHPARRARGACW